MVELRSISVDIVTLQRKHEPGETGLQLNFETIEGEKGSISMTLRKAADFELEFKSMRADAIRQSAQLD